MSIVISCLTNRRIPDVKPLQVFIKFQSTLGIKNKSISYIMMHISLGIKNVIIGKENI